MSRFEEMRPVIKRASPSGRYPCHRRISRAVSSTRRLDRKPALALPIQPGGSRCPMSSRLELRSRTPSRDERPVNRAERFPEPLHARECNWLGRRRVCSNCDLSRLFVLPPAHTEVIHGRVREVSGRVELGTHLIVSRSE